MLKRIGKKIGDAFKPEPVSWRFHENSERLLWTNDKRIRSWRSLAWYLLVGAVFTVFCSVASALMHLAGIVLFIPIIGVPPSGYWAHFAEIYLGVAGISAVVSLGIVLMVICIPRPTMLRFDLTTQTLDFHDIVFPNRARTVTIRFDALDTIQTWPMTAVGVEGAHCRLMFHDGSGKPRKWELLDRLPPSQLKRHADLLKPYFGDRVIALSSQPK